MNHTYFPIGTLLFFGVLNGCVNASPCTTTAVESISNDRGLTSLQQETKINDLCLGQKVSAFGKVTDVGRTHIDIFPENGNLVTGYASGHTFTLSADHRCGDLLKIQKGDMLRLEGTITKIWGNIQSFNFSDSVCLGNR